MEWAVIASVNGQKVVTYHRSLEQAKKEAKETLYMLGADVVSIAQLCYSLDVDGVEFDYE